MWSNTDKVQPERSNTDNGQLERWDQTQIKVN